MDRDLQNKKERSNRKRWLKTAASLCAVAAVSIAILLINPATSQAAKTCCGFEEYIEHTEECYQKTETLICPLGEEGHIRSDSCYLYTLSSLALMVSALMCGYMLRRERERRSK